MALLHPVRRAPTRQPARPYELLELASDGITLRGWRFPAEGRPRGTLVYLHGVGDNRQGSLGIANRFVPLGLDVVSVDSRAHGESGGDLCTYGFLERRDLREVVRHARPGPVVLFGHSLGAAVALQLAPDEPRVSAVVAAETFSDLRTVATERAALLLLPHLIGRAFSIVETRGRFRIDDVSPVLAARKITVPVLLVHGSADRETSPAHSERVYDALRGPKRLILVPGAGHARSLTREVWREVEDWVLERVGR